jgi:uncharacterized membrane protein YcaP (DUF421 family)
MWHPTVGLGELTVRTLVVYAAILLLLRLGGKRQIGQMGTGEFVAVLLISNAVQNAMTGGDASLGGGLLIAAVLIAVSSLVAWLTYRYRPLEELLQGRPTLLIHDGAVIAKHLEREQLNSRELRTILRRQGIHDLREIHEAVLESDGSVSVIKKSELARTGAA